MSNGHAPRGGAIGVNGEHYAGGQFLPSTHRPKGHAVKRPTFTGPKRQQIERGTWADCPAGMTSIYAAIVGTYAEERGGTLRPYLPYLDYLGDRNPAIILRRAPLGNLADLIAAYNAGARWIPCA